MILSDFKSAFRDLRRNKLLAAINVLGLSVGISACLIVYLITSYELSFDNFQPDRDRIYRVYSKFQGTFEGTNTGVPTALPGLVKTYFTGIASLTNFFTWSCGVTVPMDDEEARDLGNHDKIIVAAPDYFDVFDYYEWVIGNPEQSLSEPLQVVITESRAKIYFGDVDLANVIGRTLHYQDSLVVTVSGIIKDIKQYTDLDFTDFISFSTVKSSWLEGSKFQLDTWNAVNSSSQFFIKLSEGTSPEKVESQFSRIKDMYEANESKWDAWRPLPKMQPMSELHLNSEFGIFDHSRAVLDESTLYILIAVAALLITMAVINFINLETAQASRRAKEVAVRKVLGGSRPKLVVRFLSESFILCFLAAILSMCWTESAFNYFSEYMPSGLVYTPGSPAILLMLFCCVVVVTLLAGLYPAFIIASYRPALALKNQVKVNSGTSQSARVRKGLTIVQFSFSQIFLTVTLIVAFQLYFMTNKDLGFDPDAVVCVNTPEHGSDNQRQAFADALTAIPAIKTFTRQVTAPMANTTYSQEMSFERGNETLKHHIHVKMADTSYLKVYGMELLAGRRLFPIDSMKELLINETCMRLLGFATPEEAVGQTIDKNKTIVGVIQDFHTASMHVAIEPTVISYADDESEFGIRLNTPGNHVGYISNGLSKIEAAWKKIYPDDTFRATFLTDAIQRFYENEQRTGKLSVAATIIALFISSLGLFGLTTFTVLQRTKEIGIRRVLGASVNSILVLFSKDFVKLVMIAFVVSTPIAYYVMDEWLNNFAYRIEMTAWIFLASVFLSMLVAFATICFRTLHAAKANPVESLRYE